MNLIMQSAGFVFLKMRRRKKHKKDKPHLFEVPFHPKSWLHYILKGEKAGSR